MKQKLIEQLIDIETQAKAYFSAKSMVNPIVIDVEYSKASVPVGAKGYMAQNDGIPDRPFGAIYRDNVVLWVQQDLANITIRAAEILYKRHGWKLKVMDSLRVVEAQEAMQSVVKENHWSEEYVGRPGAGGHPRAMAIDIVPVDAVSGVLVEMGSAFDHFGTRSNRDFVDFCNDVEKNSEITSNRQALDEAMLMAADEFGLKNKLYLFPSEWWDYRFTEDVWSQYPALSDNDLPEHMRIMPKK